MAKNVKIESIIWGIFWIVIGILLLVHNFHPEFRILQNIWKIWPLLIIIIGINIIIRYFHRNE